MITFGNEGTARIIGVVADVKGRSGAGFVRNLHAGARLARQAHRRSTCLSAQPRTPQCQTANRFFDMKWIVRAIGTHAGALEPGMREAVRALDPTLAFIRFESMTSVNPTAPSTAAGVDDSARRLRLPSAMLPRCRRALWAHRLRSARVRRRIDSRHSHGASAPQLHRGIAVVPSAKA
jgi:hypothetical protein